jgi:hypothetical protein
MGPPEQCAHHIHGLKLQAEKVDARVARWRSRVLLAPCDPHGGRRVGAMLPLRSCSMSIMSVEFLSVSMRELRPLCGTVCKPVLQPFPEIESDIVKYLDIIPIT